MSEARSYRPVRALNRGLLILQKLNRLGSASPAVLAREAGIDRTTTYRLLATLADFGLVRENPSNREYVLTQNVRQLSNGFTEGDRTTQIVAAHLGTLFPKVLWPTDFALFEEGAMVIRETTHRFSPYSVHRAMVGRPRPLLTSALGRAAFAGASPSERSTMLEIVRGASAEPDAPPVPSEEQIEHLLQDYETRGYAWSVGLVEGRTSGIGVAVRTASLPAAINLVFFRSAMTVETAAERYLDHMKSCVADIERSFADAIPGTEFGAAVDPESRQDGASAPKA